MGIIPSAVLIFVVLGTMMLGLATPTEAGAMGAIGAIVLAAIHHKDFSSTGHKMLLIGIVAAGIGAIVGILLGEGHAVQAAFAVVYFAVVWLCLEAVRIPDLRDLIKQGYEIDHAHHHHGGVHPDRLDLLLGGVPRRLRRRLARAPC